MKSLASALALTLFASAPVHAQPAWRCGSEYTTDPPGEQRLRCRPIHPPRMGEPHRPGPEKAATELIDGHMRVSASDQQQRNQDSRAILETELRSTETRQSELLQEFNASSGASRDARSARRNAELKAQIARNESDIAALRREIGRTPGLR